MSAITLTDYRNTLYTILTDQQTATPTLLRKVLRARPGGIGEAPVAWIGEMTAILPTDAGIDTTASVMQGEIIIGAPFPSDLLTDADPFDALYSALVARFKLKATATILPNCILDLLQITQSDLTLQGADTSNTYQGMTLQTQLRIWEGRD